MRCLLRKNTFLAEGFHTKRKKTNVFPPTLICGLFTWCGFVSNLKCKAVKIAFQHFHMKAFQIQCYAMCFVYQTNLKTFSKFFKKKRIFCYLKVVQLRSTLANLIFNLFFLISANFVRPEMNVGIHRRNECNTRACVYVCVSEQTEGEQI